MLPRQLLGHGAFARLFAEVGDARGRFEDFRANGLLLPCDEPAALRMGLPLHRGPHRHYSQLVIERVGQIEAGWAALYSVDPQAAAIQARMRLNLLQRALRRYLLDGRHRRLRLNRHDPLGAGVDFTELDAMVDALWDATRAAVAPVLAQPMPIRACNASFAA